MMTSRRVFLSALALGSGAIFAPQFGRWHRQGSGLLVQYPGLLRVTLYGYPTRISDSRVLLQGYHVDPYDHATWPTELYVPQGYRYAQVEYSYRDDHVQSGFFVCGIPSSLLT